LGLRYNVVMQVQLRRPELEKFIDDQVRAGHFPSPEAAVEAAVEHMMLGQSNSDELDDDTAAAINRADEQIARGEGIDFKQFAAEMRKKFAAG
jgi:Arc/MetJ-type ribon-helix-helix transcriptional regulator